MPPDCDMVEGIARVVKVDVGMAWLEPEQSGGCGHCAAAAGCGLGSGGIGTSAGRIAARRFAIANADGFRVGERMVVGVSHRALLRGALTAYAIPLATALTAGGLMEGVAGSDLPTIAAMAAGLGLGMLLARIAARYQSVRGDLAPHFLRRAGSPPRKSTDGDLPPGGAETGGAARRVSADGNCAGAGA